MFGTCIEVHRSYSKKEDKMFLKTILLLMGRVLFIGIEKIIMDWIIFFISIHDQSDCSYFPLIFREENRFIGSSNRSLFLNDSRILY